jgi:hypothetical protein
MYSFPLLSKQLIPADLARLQLELELARRVQLSLLPKNPPAIHGLDLWAFINLLHMWAGISMIISLARTRC